MMYVVLVTEVITSCTSKVVDASDEASAITAAIEAAKRDDLAEISHIYAGEVVRAIVPAAAAAHDPHAKKTVAMKVLPRTCDRMIDNDRHGFARCGNSLPCPDHHSPED